MAALADHVMAWAGEGGRHVLPDDEAVTSDSTYEREGQEHRVMEAG